MEDFISTCHHGWEPFPGYRPWTRRQKIRFALVRLRWALFRPFIRFTKYKEYYK